MDFKIINIKEHHKNSIHKLIQSINKADNLEYSLTDEWLDYIIENSSESIFLGFHGKHLAGLGTCMINSLYRDQAALNVIVHPDYRKQGLGSILYKRLDKFARMKDVKILEAYVKKRLIDGVSFAEKREFNIGMYSWEMELDLGKIDYPLDRDVDLNFRKANNEDGLNYRKIINNVFGDDLGEEALGEILRDPSVEIYILEKEGQAIGSASLQVRRDLSLAYIYDIAILSDYRGQGLGSHLIKSCLMDVKGQDIAKASLQVTGENKGALKLYKRIGFKEVDIDYIMVKKID